MRLHTIPADTLALASVFTASITGWLSDKDWERIVGPFGGLVVSLLMLLVLIRHSSARIKRDDERAAHDREEREKCHQEAMKIQRELGKRLDSQGEKLMAITVESIKAQGKATVAIESVDRTMQHLTAEWERKPCNPFGK
jgi:hypothetical protein